MNKNDRFGFRSADEQQEFLDRLQKVCIDTRLYCRPKLHRQDLVRGMRTNSTYFSQRLQAATGRTFFEYINHIRLEEARRLILTDPNMSIDQVMRTVGYTASTTFFRLFKQEYGCTPLQMRNMRLAK